MRAEEPQAVWERSIRAKALDAMRGLLPAAVLGRCHPLIAGFLAPRCCATPARPTRCCWLTRTPATCVTATPAGASQVVSVKSASGVGFERQDDGSYLVTGDRPDKDAPVSPLYYDGRVEDLAFEKPSGKSADRRHHVRFVRLRFAARARKDHLRMGEAIAKLVDRERLE